jgi:hypothetical protein
LNYIEQHQEEFILANAWLEQFISPE